LPVARINLFCLPYAGAGAGIFRGWEQRLPDWVGLRPVHLPGRGKLRHEAAIHHWPELIARLMADLAADLQTPFAIFGHSLGALIGIELAQAIRNRCGREPIWMGASASIAPAHRERDAGWLTRPATEVLNEVRQLNGTPAELLEHEELLELLLPVLRADFHLCGTFVTNFRRPLDCPVTAFGGLDDPISTPRENLTSWSRETTGPFDLQMMPGGHFFIDQSPVPVIGKIATALAAAVGRETAHA